MIYRRNIEDGLVLQHFLFLSTPLQQVIFIHGGGVTYAKVIAEKLQIGLPQLLTTLDAVLKNDPFL